MSVLNANAVAIQLPIGAENDFVGMIDLIERVAYKYKDDLGKDPEKVEIPAEYARPSGRASCGIWLRKLPSLTKS